ncbi:unnamed protein product [Peniophora sp. CBMAI 1063]|nr:unnamed protein product [Peniophora sp. CBMAI 1063]
MAPQFLNPGEERIFNKIRDTVLKQPNVVLAASGVRSWIVATRFTAGREVIDSFPPIYIYLEESVRDQYFETYTLDDMGKPIGGKVRRTAQSKDGQLAIGLLGCRWVPGYVCLDSGKVGNRCASVVSHVKRLCYKDIAETSIPSNLDLCDAHVDTFLPIFLPPGRADTIGEWTQCLAKSAHGGALPTLLGKRDLLPIAPLVWAEMETIISERDPHFTPTPYDLVVAKTPIEPSPSAMPIAGPSLLATPAAPALAPNMPGNGRKRKASHIEDSEEDAQPDRRNRRRGESPTIDNTTSTSLAAAAALPTGGNAPLLSPQAAATTPVPGSPSIEENVAIDPLLLEHPYYGVPPTLLPAAAKPIAEAASVASASEVVANAMSRSSHTAVEMFIDLPTWLRSSPKE